MRGYLTRDCLRFRVQIWDADEGGAAPPDQAMPGTGVGMSQSSLRDFHELVGVPGPEYLLIAANGRHCTIDLRSVAGGLNVDRAESGQKHGLCSLQAALHLTVRCLIVSLQHQRQRVRLL